jgi:hypothetical protein
LSYHLCTRYFHELFEPGVDHVPVAEDFVDLEEKAAKIAADPKAAAVMVDKW